MITLHNNDDMRPRRNHNVIKIKVKQPWELGTWHREDRGNTLFDNRPKRQRTRSAQKRKACEDHDY